MNDFDDIEILLVEDNPQDAEMTQRALKKSNMLNRLLWVKDGVEAMEFINGTGAFDGRDIRQLPKLMLLDLKMPRLDGIDVLRAMKSEERTRTVPIVIMTSSSQERDVAESYRLGVNGYVTKPVQLDSFVEAVARLGMFWLFVNKAPVA